MKTSPFIAGFLGALLSLPIPLHACSLVGCLGDGVELRRNFVVRVTHQGKPLAGVSVSIRPFNRMGDSKPLLLTTDSHGAARIANLPAGQYWLDSDLLGISAGGSCFHVAETSSNKAKKRLNYEWGDLAQSTRQVEGALTESRPGEGGTPFQNLLHRVEAPIPGAKMKLTNPLNGAVYDTVSGADGHFSFGTVPNGTYVFHVESGSAPAQFEPSNLVVKLDPKAGMDKLMLEARESGCGGIWVGIRYPPH
jgi:hypothetical protein